MRNRENYNKNMKKWLTKNSEHRKEWLKEYRRRNRERIRKWEREYKAKYAIKHSHLCPVCGKSIRKESTFCIKHKKHQPSGPLNPCWRGGRVKDVNGYIRIYKPEHPRADSKKQVYQHIIVWEETHGKMLLQGWVVHHLNGIKDDNRPVNLEALPARAHMNVLAAKARRIQELEAQLKSQGQLI